MRAGSLLLFSAVLFSGSFSLILAGIQIFVPRRSVVNWISAFGFLCKAVVGIVGGLLSLGARPTFLIHIYSFIVPATFLSISSGYIYYRSVLNRSPRLRPRDAVHAVIPLLSIILFALASAKTFLPDARFQGEAVSEMLINGSRYVNYLLSMTYSIALFKRMFRLFRPATRDFRNVMICIGGLRVAMFLIDLAWLIDRTFSLAIAPYLYILFSPYLVLLLFFFLRYPHYFLSIKEDTGNVRYARSRIAGLNTGEIMERLESLMKNERVYSESTLSLGRLAARLRIEPHQLSELFNARLGKSYLEIVNFYRVEEAKRILLEHPDRKVLDITYDVGFNSASTFYNAFKKITGTTPAGFRKKL